MKRSANHHAERCRELADILIVPLREELNKLVPNVGIQRSFACFWRSSAGMNGYAALDL